MEQRKKTSLESDYALALEYSRVAALMMQTVASRAMSGLDKADGPDRYVPLKFLLDPKFVTSEACSGSACRQKYADLVADFSRMMSEIYESRRDRMEDSRSWSGFAELWSEWLEIKVLIGQLRAALFLYDLGLSIAVKIAQRAGDHVLEMCPKAVAPVIPIRSSV